MRSKIPSILCNKCCMYCVLQYNIFTIKLGMSLEPIYPNLGRVILPAASVKYNITQEILKLSAYTFRYTGTPEHAIFLYVPRTCNVLTTFFALSNAY